MPRSADSQISPANEVPGGSWASSVAIRKTMLGNRSRDTVPELALRSAVHRLGLRYRACCAPLAGMRRTADMVFRRQQVAVFMDGCFWHGCPKHFIQPRTNPDYWREKIVGNRKRDRKTDRELRAAGWIAVRVWEHEEAASAAERVAEVVRSRAGF